MATQVEETVSTREESSNLSNLTAVVKWFNAKTGFGYVTVIDGDMKREDVFVHHSAIVLDKSQYKYLVQGEYVNVDIALKNDGPHKHEVSRVSGILGGDLMCVTRNANSRRRKPLAKKDETTNSASNDERAE